MPQMVVLWTDGLLFLLFGTGFIFALISRGKEHLRAPWRHVARSRMGMSSLVIISLYVVIGLLDSVHFYPKLDIQTEDASENYSSEIISLFDYFLTPLRERQEKTYSAPMATHLYAKESIELAGGTQTRDYPRLKYGGSHLVNPAQEKTGDVIRLMLLGTVEALFVWGLIVLWLVIAIARYRNKTRADMFRLILQGKSEVPWRAVLTTIGIVLLLMFISGNISLNYHLFGTDKVGEDVFYQALKSIRTGLVIGTLTTLVMLPAAILLGIMAGYFRGWVDDVIQYLYTTLNSIPGVLLIAASVLMLQVYMSNHQDDFNSLVERADLRLLFLCLILGVTSWTSLCRYLRGEALKLRSVDYVQAATAFGVGPFTIIRRHIVPNVMHIVLITIVLDFSGLVLAEAVLSYVNIGVDPTMNSWGNMINSARLEMAREPIVWWSLAAAMLFMFTLVLCANLFADVVRDAFDPRLRNSQ